MKGSVLAVLALAYLIEPAFPSEDTGDLRKRLTKAIDARSNDQVKACLEAMIKAGGKENIDVLLKLLPKIPPSEDAIYWDLVQGACSFTDREAMEHLGDSIVRFRSGGISRDLIFGLAKNRSPNAVFALSGVLQRGAPDIQVMAAEKMGTIPTPDAVDALIAALKREEGKADSELGEAIIGGLESLTGQSFQGNTVNWEGWWKQNRDKAVLGRGSRREGGTGTVVDRLDKGREKKFLGLELAPKKAVIVLSAEFPKVERNPDLNNDHIERVLERMGIPHTVVKRPDFEGYDLRGVGAIIINCAQFHEICICPDCVPGQASGNRLHQCTNCSKHVKFTAKLTDASIKKLQDFVRKGGSLFCEDWTVKEILERAFPKYANTGKVLTKATVDVVPARGRASHPLLKGVFRPEHPPEPEGGAGEDDEDGPKRGGTVPKKPEEPEKPPEPELVKVKHQWVIDDESWAFKIADYGKVVVLLTSGKLQKTAEGEGVVAFCFRPGGEEGDTSSARRRSGPGLVMQVLSHFGKQHSADDEYTLQNLLLNFLMQANIARDQKELSRAKKKDGKEKAGKEDKPGGEEQGGPEGDPGE